MKRSTAQKRILTHLKYYRKRLANDNEAQLGGYASRTGATCPLCVAINHFGPADCLTRCLQWPGGKTCTPFMGRVNALKTVLAKLRQIDKLEKELDRWAAEI